MGSNYSYKITLSNNKTEQAALDYLLEAERRYLLPTLESRKIIAEMFGFEPKFKRTFDLLLIDGHDNTESEIDLRPNDKNRVTLVEIKSTMKKLPDNPYGFFFGATKNEFDMAELLGAQYKFCFVCMHPETRSHRLLSLPELKPLIRSQRTQYQINLKSGSKPDQSNGRSPDKRTT